MSSPRLEALLEISDTIGGTLDLAELLRLLAPALRRAVEFDYVAVLLHDAENNMMHLHLVEKFFDGPTPTASITTERSPSGLCFLTQQPLIITDVDSETRFAPEVIELFKKYNVQSCCYLP